MPRKKEILLFRAFSMFTVLEIFLLFPRYVWSQRPRPLTRNTKQFSFFLLFRKQKKNMLCPKHTRYRKIQKGKNPLNKLSKSSDILQFGRYGLKILSSGFLRSNTIEAVRRVLTRKLKRHGQIWIRIFPDKSRSQKPIATRMGKGKGAPSYWYVPVQAGQIIFEMDGIALPLAKQSAIDAAGKLPYRAVFIFAS